jgi:hypothetical protein
MVPPLSSLFLTEITVILFSEITLFKDFLLRKKSSFTVWSIKTLSFCCANMIKNKQTKIKHVQRYTCIRGKDNYLLTYLRTTLLPLLIHTCTPSIAYNDGIEEQLIESIC